MSYSESLAQSDLTDWPGEVTRSLALEALDERLQRYRLVQPKLERQMAASLREYGQVSPVIVCRLDGQMVLVDGFKRLRAARSLKGVTHLSARLLETDAQGAKAAVFNLNRIAGKPVELEEAWIIYALVEEDGLQQVEVAQLLGRHKSWVNRRLALIQRLCESAREAASGPFDTDSSEASDAVAARQPKRGPGYRRPGRSDLARTVRCRGPALRQQYDGTNRLRAH
jgi:ParB-like chromosome segregation protein Spo0J